jgi:hypothetical protein
MPGIVPRIKHSASFRKIGGNEDSCAEMTFCCVPEKRRFNLPRAPIYWPPAGAPRRLLILAEFAKAGAHARFANVVTSFFFSQCEAARAG